MTGIRVPLTRVLCAFRNLDSLAPGDDVSLTGAGGRRYAFQVYKHADGRIQRLSVL